MRGVVILKETLITAFHLKLVRRKFHRNVNGKEMFSSGKQFLRKIIPKKLFRFWGDKKVSSKRQYAQCSSFVEFNIIKIAYKIYVGTYVLENVLYISMRPLTNFVCNCLIVAIKL